LVNGSTSNRSTEVGQFLIPLPKKDERQEIITLIRSVKEIITATESEIFAFQYLKRALLQNLLTGKVRVKLQDAIL
jgi:type I restriction enzyme S subunit